ncbi:T9SS type A sorting domain-containing protein [Parasediminibacterium sp. JCM 36343]|uniref:T9SS type A sorting domain-containing protein n=1 Tax=Parasediminibacterium sp. JCM 36343 TaxID=3374279 RepID=UPI003978430F
MFKHLFSVAFACFFFTLSIQSFAQSPIKMASQVNFTYKETFADVSNWVFTAPVDGTFSAGIGASAWKGCDISTTGTVPSATKLTVATTSWQTYTAQSSLPGLYRAAAANIQLVATGTTDNTAAVAMDFFMDFTGVNAGTLSFDWAEVKNYNGNRNGSLKVYATVDGTNFTEITAAAVLNVTNNVATSGTISFAALPAIFNNSATARLRFYYYNGVGGTTGSRPKISIDNVQVTATGQSVCTTPKAQPTGFTANTIAYSSVQASFTAPATVPEGYLVVASVNSSLSSGPVDGKSYAIGDNLGDGSVVATTNTNSFTATALGGGTTYNFFVFSMNHLCSGGPLYLAASPLVGTATTLTGSEPCAAPAVQPTDLVFSNITSSSVFGSFTGDAADNYLIVRTTTTTLNTMPVNGTTYKVNGTLDNGTIVAFTPGNTFTAAGLSSGTTYYYFIFGANNLNCTGGIAYNKTSPLTKSVTTSTVVTCAPPTNAPTGLQLTITDKQINGYFKASTSADSYLVLYGTASTLTQLPQDGGNYTVGSTLGNAKVLANGKATAFTAAGLSAGTAYYFFIFSENKFCSGTPKYLTTTILQGNITTLLSPLSNIYFGNLHAHSSYSDGNKDSTSFIPAQDYAFAKNSLCLDYLGISEHNHAGAGMNVSNWQPGIAQAAAATTSNFLALYGMEWGVISGGGHVLVYGSDKLLGWETNNYNIYVPKSDYIGTPSTTGTSGLFTTINSLGNNTVALLAHPSTTDYDNLSGIPFNLTADSAIVGAAVSSGPAFSTNTTYTDPATSLGYYTYFKSLLARGYHIGPSMDHDNHYTTFGRTSTTRLAIASTALTTKAMLSALKARHFYATEDCDTRVTFTLNNQQMGNIFTGTTPPAMSVYAIDPTNTAAVPKIIVMYGIPGSGVSPVMVDSATGYIFNLTDINLPNNTTAYYYAEITIAGSKTITSPIWYTYSNGTMPVTLASLKATVTASKFIAVDWATTSEINNKWFVVEKSTDGMHFFAIDSVTGNGTSGSHTYSITDKNPIDGINYYRLLQIDLDGKGHYSNIVSANVGQAAINFFTIKTNPVVNLLPLNINAKANQQARVLITDMSGRVLQNNAASFIKGGQQFNVNTSQLTSGTYTVTVDFGDMRQSKLFVK